jgi:Tol biopolymer transport system component
MPVQQKPGIGRRSAPAVLSLVALAILSACADSGGRSASMFAWSIESAAVLFTGRRDGLTDLYVLDRSTDRTRRLTELGTAEGGANAAAISPDGRRLAFQVRRNTDYEIHVMDMEGGESENVTRHPEYDVSPAWSPDGRSLAFMSTRGFELGGLGPFPGHIYVKVLGTDSLRRITNEPLTSSFGPSDWSSDGATVLIARVVDGSPDVFLLDVVSGAEIRITDAAEAEYSATFSHAGDRIAFHAEGESGSQIVVLDLVTGERRAVTDGSGYRYAPVWSPDDQWLLFTSSQDGEQYDIQAVQIDGGLVLDIVSTPEDEREGRWLPRR